MGQRMLQIQLDKVPPAQALLHGGQTALEMPAMPRIRLVPIMILDAAHDQIGMHHLVHQHRPHVPQPRRRQLHVHPVQPDPHARRPGPPPRRRRAARHALGAVGPAEVDVLVEAAGEEDGVDVVEGLEDDVFAEAGRVAQFEEAVEGGGFGGAAGLGVEAFEFAGGAAEGLVGLGAGAAGVGLEDVELGLGDGVWGAVSGEDVFFVEGVVFGGEGEVHCWFGGLVRIEGGGAGRGWWKLLRV